MKSINLHELYAVCDQAGDASAAPSVIADNFAGYALLLDVGGERYCPGSARTA